MKWPTRQADFDDLKKRLSAYRCNQGSGLAGIASEKVLDTLAMQIVASQRREDYYKLIQRKTISAARANPNSGNFDAERAVAFHLQQGNSNEACWLIFLMTHFARHPNSGWKRLGDVYGLLGQGTLTWEKYIADPQAFTEWLEQNWSLVGGAFGNHRKYESLRPDANRPFARVLQSYVQLVGDDHQQFFTSLNLDETNDPFDVIFMSLNILGFGRLAKFDYLMLLARYGILQVGPRSAYLGGATGPKLGAKLLFMSDPNAEISDNELQSKLDHLDDDLALGMEVLEDALCNWQKSPDKFVHFVG